MQWLQAMFQGQSAGATLIAIVVGLAVALVLLFWIFRKIAGTNPTQQGRARRRARLAVVDVTRVDGKRRLVLVRRDDTEHLVLIGGGSDVLVESNIEPPAIPERVPAESPARAYRELQREKDVVPDPAENAAATAAAAAAVAIASSEEASPRPEPAVESAAAEETETFRLPSDLQESRDYSEASKERPEFVPPRPEAHGETTAIPEPEPAEAVIPEVSAEEDEMPLEVALGAELEGTESGKDSTAQRRSGTAAEFPSVDRENQTRPSSGTRSKTRTDSNVEDEMQRLLDELSNN